MVRLLHVTNETATSAKFRLSIGTDGAGKRLFYDMPVDVGPGFDWRGSLVLAAGEVQQAYADTATALVICGVVST